MTVSFSKLWLVHYFCCLANQKKWANKGGYYVGVRRFCVAQLRLLLQKKICKCYFNSGNILKNPSIWFVEHQVAYPFTLQKPIAWQIISGLAFSEINFIIFGANSSTLAEHVLTSSKPTRGQ